MRCCHVILFKTPLHKICITNTQNCFSKNTTAAGTRLLRGFILLGDYIYIYTACIHTRTCSFNSWTSGISAQNGFSISIERVFVLVSGGKFVVPPAHFIHRFIYLRIFYYDDNINTCAVCLK